MPRKASWPPRVTKHATGQARVYWRGRTYYLGLHGSSEAQRAYAALLVRLTEEGTALPGDPPPLPGAATVADVVAQFLDAAERERPAGQLKYYRLSLLPVLRVCGSLPASEFDDLALERVRDAMLSGSWMNAAERARRERMCKPIGWARENTARHLTRVRTCWRWAERRKLVPRGAWSGLRTLPPLAKHERGAREMPRRSASSQDDLAKVLGHVQAKRRERPCAAMLELQHLTGMRTGEVCVMRPCDIDREIGLCVDGVRVWVYRPHRHKLQHLDLPRVVALGPRAQAILKPWLDRCPEPEAYLFRPAWGGDHYQPGVYDSIIRRACAKAGIKLIPYGGRRATADRVKRAYSLDHARAVLGHASVEQTADYCDLLDLETAARIAAQLG